MLKVTEFFSNSLQSLKMCTYQKIVNFANTGRIFKLSADFMQLLRLLSHVFTADVDVVYIL